MLFLSLVGIFHLCRGTHEDGQAMLEEAAKHKRIKKLGKKGILVEQVHEGWGKFHPHPTTPISLWWEGKLLNGTKFGTSYSLEYPDDNYSHIRAKDLPVWGMEYAVQRMVVGADWIVYMPSELAFGDERSPEKWPAVAPGDPVMFHMILQDILGTKQRRSKRKMCNFETNQYCHKEEIVYFEQHREDSNLCEIKKEMETLNQAIYGTGATEEEKEAHRSALESAEWNRLINNYMSLTSVKEYMKVELDTPDTMCDDEDIELEL